MRRLKCFDSMWKVCEIPASSQFEGSFSVNIISTAKLSGHWYKEITAATAATTEIITKGLHSNVYKKLFLVKIYIKIYIWFFMWPFRPLLKATSGRQLTIISSTSCFNCLWVQFQNVTTTTLSSFWSHTCTMLMQAGGLLLLVKWPLVNLFILSVV